MALELATPNPAYATIKKLLSDPVDVLLRPKGGWKRPDNLLTALAEEIATNKGEELYLMINPASDDAQQAVEDTLNNRK